MKISINKLSDGRIASVSYGNIIIYKKSDLEDLEKGIALGGSWIQIGTFTIKKQNDNNYIINEEPISAENLQKLLDAAKKKLSMLRKGCRASKTEKACPAYSYPLGKCTLGRVKYTCWRCEQPKAGTKKAAEAESCRSFYNGSW